MVDRRGVKSRAATERSWKVALLERCKERVTAQREELLHRLRSGVGTAELLSSLVDTEMFDDTGGRSGALSQQRPRKTSRDRGNLFHTDDSNCQHGNNSEDDDLTADERIDLLLYLERMLYGIGEEGSESLNTCAANMDYGGESSADAAAALYQQLEDADARHLAALIEDASLAPPLTSFDDAAAMLDDDDGSRGSSGRNGDYRVEDPTLANSRSAVVTLPRNIASLPLPLTAAADARLTDILCPTCAAGRLAAIGPLLRCRGGGPGKAPPCGLALDTSAGFDVDALQQRLGEAHAAHAARGCGAALAFSVRQWPIAGSKGPAALFASCAACGELGLVA